MDGVKNGETAPAEDPPIPLKEAEDGEYADPMEAQATLWMSQTKSGDPTAFDRLVESLGPRAFSVARSLVGSSDDARDLCQEAFLKTYKARDSYRDGEPFLPWFHRILRNTCYSFLRKNKRIKSHSLSHEVNGEATDYEIVDPTPGPTDAPERAEVVEAFWDGFARLNATDREILALRHFQDLSYRAIARTLDLPEGTVMSRLFHARKRLRRALAGHLEGALADFNDTEATGRHPR